MIVVQRGGHAVEPEAVEMVLLQPELQIGKQKVQNAGLTVIKALGSPGRMLTRFSVVEELPGRSEERRVEKECRSRWSPYH